MSERVVARLKQQFGDRILEATHFRGDDTVIVAPSEWKSICLFLRDDPELQMDHFVDLTAVDYPEREPELPRFDLVLHMRSLANRHRIRVKTRIGDGDSVDSLCEVWPAANWAERECWDMFGLIFSGHPDPRRILLYEEFVGHPLRKDYPIDKAQPLVTYRDVEGTEKLAPFGPTEGQPWGRIDWQERLSGRDLQVSPAIGVQVGQRRALSDTTAHIAQMPLGKDGTPDARAAAQLPATKKE